MTEKITRTFPKLISLLSFIAMIFFLTVHIAIAATINVNTQTDEDVSNGTCSLREAIIAVNTSSDYNGCTNSSVNAYGTSDTIILPAGIYTLIIPSTDEDNAADGDLDIRVSLLISGAGQNSCIIQAGTNTTNGIDRVFDIWNGAAVVLNDLTVRYGRIESFNGGGLLLRSGSLGTDRVTISHNTAVGQSGGGIFGSPGAANITITNSSVTNNTVTAGSWGGGIYSNVSLVIDQSIIANNTADQGGGIFIVGAGTLTVTNSSISNNTANNGNGGGINSNVTTDIDNVTINNNTVNNRGGGIYKSGGTNLTIDDSTLSNNRTLTETGGAIYSGSQTSINTVTISNNTAAESGGGIYKEGADFLEIYDSTFDGNRATSNNGGAIRNASIARIENVTISGNTANDDGGGIFNTADPAILINVTINRNSAGSGGGIYGSSGRLELVNTIVANSLSGGDCSGGAIFSLGHNLSSDNTCSTFFTAIGDLNNTNPLLRPLGNWGGPTQTHTLSSNSPAIDTASTVSAPVTDQRGVARPQDGDGDGIVIEADRGAVEMRQNEYNMTIPTLTEWGMIIFIMLAGLGAVLYLRRQKRVNY